MPNDTTNNNNVEQLNDIYSALSQTPGYKGGGFEDFVSKFKEDYTTKSGNSYRDVVYARLNDNFGLDYSPEEFSENILSKIPSAGLGVQSFDNADDVISYLETEKSKVPQAQEEQFGNFMENYQAPNMDVQDRIDPMEDAKKQFEKEISGESSFIEQEVSSSPYTTHKHFKEEVELEKKRIDEEEELHGVEIEGSEKDGVSNNNEADKEAQGLLEQITEKQKTIEKIKTLIEESDYILGIGGNKELDDRQKELLTERLSEHYNELTGLQGKVNHLRKAHNDEYLGMTPDERKEEKATQRAIERERNEVEDVLGIYNLSPNDSEKMKDYEFDVSVGEDINKDIDSALQEMLSIDPAEYSKNINKSRADIAKDIFYKEHWPKFKQMLANYDKDELSSGLFGMFNEMGLAGGSMIEMSELLNEDDTSHGMKLDDIPKEGETPKESELRSQIQKTILWYYLAEKGKSVEGFFGAQDYEDGNFVENTVDAGLIQGLFEGGHEFLMKAEGIAGPSLGMTDKMTIRNDLKLRSNVAPHVVEFMSRAGVKDPEEIKNWTKKNNWERASETIKTTTDIMLEFAAVDIMTGGLGALAKGTGALGKFVEAGKAIDKTVDGIKAEKRLTEAAGEISLAIKSLENTAKYGKNPMARFFAKSQLTGLNAIKSGVKYEYVGQVFDNENLDYTSGVAGSVGSSIVAGFFNKVPPGVVKSLTDFIGKGLGEVTEETFQEISQSGFNKFVNSMKDPEELTWFLASTFVMGAAMGGSQSDLKTWTLLEYEKLSPEQKRRFDEETGRAEIGRFHKELQSTKNMSEFGKRIREKLKPTSHMTQEEADNIRQKTDEETGRILDETSFEVSDRVKETIKERNRERVFKGMDPLDESQILEVLNEPVDVTKNYNENMTEDEFFNQIIRDIEDHGKQDNNLLEVIDKMPEGPNKKAAKQMLKTAEIDRKDNLRKIQDEVKEEVEPVEIKEDITKSKYDGNFLYEMYKKFKINHVDIHHSVKKAQERLKKLGGVINDDFNFYDKLTLSKGVVSRQVVELDYEILNPDNENSTSSRIIKSGGDEDSFGDFLYAMNAPEKNKALRKIHGEETDRNSGMTDKEASEIISELKEKGLYESYVEIEKDFRKRVIEPILEQKYNEGIINRKEYDIVRDSYEFYVPTKIDSEKLGYDYQSTIGGGSGLRKGISKIMGTTNVGKDKRYNPYFKSVKDNMAMLNTVRTNQEMKSLADMIRYNGLDKQDNAAFKIHENQPSFTEGGRDNSVEFYEDGKKKWITIEDNDFLIALKDKPGPKSESARAALGLLQTFTNFKRKISTNRSFGFVFKNPIRDYQAAFSRLETFGIDASFVDYNKAIKESVVDFSKEGPAIMQGKPAKTKGGKEFEKLLKLGGITTWADYAQAGKDISDIQKKLKTARNRNGYVKFADNVIMLGYIEKLSEIGEVGTRLAVYKLAKQSGLSDNKAAIAAREVTINFDRKGRASWWMNNLWMFSNAAIQGNYNLASSIVKSKKMRAYAAASFGAKFALRALNEAIKQGEDEDDAIYSFDDEKNINILNIFSDKENDYFKIPIAQGLDLFAYAGGMAYDMIYKDKDAGEVMSDMFKVIMNTANPLESATMLQTISPTITDAMAQHYENKTYYNSNLYPEPYAGEESAIMAFEHFDNATFVGKNLASIENKLQFGKPGFEKGVLDWSPNVWDNYFSFMTGGVGKFWSEAISNSIDVYDGNFKIEEAKLPIVSGFHRQGNPDQGNLSRVYKIKKESGAEYMSDEDIMNVKELVDKLYLKGSLDGKKASEIMKAITTNQKMIRQAETEGFSSLKEYKEHIKKYVD